MPRQKEEHQQARRATRPPASRPPILTSGYSAGSPESDAGSTSHHEHAEQQQHRHQIEQALENDRGEARRRRKPFAFRQQIRPQHFAGTRRQQKARREPDHRGLERCRNRVRPDRGQQILPAERAQGVRHHRHADARRTSRRGSAWRVFSHTSPALTPRRKYARQPDREHQNTRAARSRDRIRVTVGIRIRMAGRRSPETLLRKLDAKSMGKRELVLIAVFVVLGVLRLPGHRPAARAGVRGPQRRRHFPQHEARYAGRAGVRDGGFAPDRSGRRGRARSCGSTSHGRATSPSRAKIAPTSRPSCTSRRAVTTRPRPRRAADAVKLKIDRVRRRRGRRARQLAARQLPRDNSVPQLVIVLKVPSRLAVPAQSRTSAASIVSHLASAEIMGSRGETRDQRDRRASRAHPLRRFARARRPRIAEAQRAQQPRHREEGRRRRSPWTRSAATWR